jgi:hypothetical protein
MMRHSSRRRATLGGMAAAMVLGCVFPAMKAVPDDAGTIGSVSGGASATGGHEGTGGSPETGGTTAEPATGGVVSTGGNANTGGAMSTGGTKATGGAISAGGTKATGGAIGTGGAIATGGAISTGGAIATGGAVSTDGTKATGGAISTGGTSIIGGTSSTGGAVPTGGTISTGGTTSTGGATATGGTSVINTGNTVTFSSSGKASGAMSGWSYIALGAQDTVSDPTCGASQAVITSTVPCTTSINWSGTNGLCITGYVPVADSQYKSWGINLGVNSTPTDGEILGQSFVSITYSIAGVPTPASSLRAIVNVGSTEYCAPVTSGTAIALTSFVTDCWNGATAAGTRLTAANVKNITRVSVQITANETVAITVTNMCLAGIRFD